MKEQKEPLSTRLQTEPYQPQANGSASITDNRHSIVYQRQLRSGIESSTDNSNLPLQRKPNRTGIPEQLKSGLENLSGYAMDDVNVHYNSSKPAQLNALAYAQGTDIHLGSGQEKHLPHEAWHVVQQKQGRVRPTRQFQGRMAINDDAGLEREADVMGQKALQLKTHDPSQLKEGRIMQGPIQRKIGFEFQAFNSVFYDSDKELYDYWQINLGEGEEKSFQVQADTGGKYGKNKLMEMEIVTKPVEETTEGREELIDQMNNIVAFTSSISHNRKLGDITEGNIKWHKNFTEEQLLVQGSVNFHPQATVGIKFEKIADLVDAVAKATFRSAGSRINNGFGDWLYYNIAEPIFTKFGWDSYIYKAPHQELTDQFGWSGKKDQRPFKEAWLKGLAKAKKIEKASDKAVGFLTVLFSLAEISKMKMKVVDDSEPRYFATFFFRTKILPFFNSLDKEDIILIDEVLPDSVLNEKVVPTKKMTIREFYEDLKEGKDIRIFNEEYSNNIQDLYNLKTISDIGISDNEKERDGALIELRKLGNEVTPNQLKPFALAVFDLVKAINAED